MCTWKMRASITGWPRRTKEGEEAWIDQTNLYVSPLRGDEDMIIFRRPLARRFHVAIGE